MAGGLDLDFDIGKYLGDLYNNTKGLAGDTLDWFGTDAGKNTLGGLETMAKIGSVYETAKYNQGLLDIYNRNLSQQEAERQRQIAKEGKQEANLAAGFNLGWKEEEDKTTSTDYYGVQ